MNLRASQVKIIREHIASRIADLKARQGQGNPVIDTAMDIAITELIGIQETIKFACELAAPAKPEAQTRLEKLVDMDERLDNPEIVFKGVKPT